MQEEAYVIPLSQWKELGESAFLQEIHDTQEMLLQILLNATGMENDTSQLLDSVEKKRSKEVAYSTGVSAMRNVAPRKLSTQSTIIFWTRNVVVMAPT